MQPATSSPLCSASASTLEYLKPHGPGQIHKVHDTPASTKLHSTNPIERLNGEIKRRTDVVGIFPNEASIRRLVGAILMEQTEEWTVQRGRYLTLETLAPICDDVIVSLPAAQRD